MPVELTNAAPRVTAPVSVSVKLKLVTELSPIIPAAVNVVLPVPESTNEDNLTSVMVAIVTACPLVLLVFVSLFTIDKEPTFVGVRVIFIGPEPFSVKLDKDVSVKVNVPTVGVVTPAVVVLALLLFVKVNPAAELVNVVLIGPVPVYVTAVKARSVDAPMVEVAVDVLVLFTVIDVARSPEIEPIAKPAPPEMLMVESPASVKVVIVSTCPPTAAKVLTLKVPIPFEAVAVPVDESVKVNAVIVCAATVGAVKPAFAFKEFVVFTPIEIGNVAVAPVVPVMLTESVPAVATLNQTGVPGATLENPTFAAEATFNKLNVLPVAGMMLAML